MPESDDRDDEVDAFPQNLNPRNTPIHVTGLYPGWQSNISTQSQQESPQFEYNQTCPNMGYYQPHFQMAPYPNMFFQQSVGTPQHQTTQPTFQQPVGAPPHQTTHPTFQQPVGNPQHQTTQPTVDVSASRRITRPSSLKANLPGKRNWTKEEDIQLTIAWVRISTDPVVGVGQKKDTLYERILKLFVKLMHENHQLNPEDCVRTANALDNRMSEIKGQCSRWTATRAQVLGSYKSGWSPEDIEKLCLETHKGQGKGSFKWKECWEILRGEPKWHDYLNTKSADDSQRTAPKRARRTPPSSDPQTDPQTEPQTGESIPNDTSHTMETHTPYTPSVDSMCSEAEVGGNGRGACTPILDGPASIEIERPPGTTISKKPNNQRQRRIKKHSESVASASQSFTASLMNLESASTCQWEKLGEENRKRDLKDDERLDDMKRKHDLEHIMKVGNERSTTVQDRATIGEKLFVAIQQLDQMDPCSLATNNQRRLYEIRKKIVDDFEEQYEALGVLLSCSKVVSPHSVPAKENVERGGTSQRRLFDEDVVCLGQDSPR